MHGPIFDDATFQATVRAAAIEIATAACARALRDAAQQPAVLESWIDEAIRAAELNGSRVERILLAPGAEIEKLSFPASTDTALQRGDVVVVTESGMVHGTVEERARLLVRREADG